MESYLTDALWDGILIEGINFNFPDLGPMLVCRPYRYLPGGEMQLPVDHFYANPLAVSVTGESMVSTSVDPATKDVILAYLDDVPPGWEREHDSPPDAPDTSLN